MRTLIEAPRRCGNRKPGGFYLVSEVSGDGVLAPLTLISPPIPTKQPFSRGYTTVNGDAILNREPEESWAVGATRKRLDKDAWFVEHFGMPMNKRADWGVCKGAKTEEACMVILIDKVRFYSQILKVVEDIGRSKTNNLVAASYASLVQAIQSYVKTTEVSNLVQAAAAAHRMLIECPAQRKNQIKPYVIRLLSFLGLSEDAIMVAKE